MKKLEIFKCNECELLIETVVGQNCCDDKKIDGFTKLEPKTQDATTEKHVPFIEEKADGYLVKVGKETAHPMTAEHHIEFIEILVDENELHRKYLKAGDLPEAYFKVAKGKKVEAREYCNLHGLWKDK